jgi:hypothetical protein
MPFFSTIDWDALYARRVRPPFEPCRNRGEEDTANFEQEFTNMPLQSFDERSGLTAMQQDNDGTFLHFTYEEESVLESLRDSWALSRHK